MKKAGFVILGVLVVAGLFILFRGYGGSTMDDYSNEKDGGQTLTVLADKASVFSEAKGYYFVQKSGAPAKGRYTRSQNTFILHENDGREWTLTQQVDFSLRDESGTIWRHKSHMESNESVEDNRATCRETQGTNCPY